MLTEAEPEVLVVATERTDRSKINMRFPVERHYFSGSNFHAGMKTVKTEFQESSLADTVAAALQQIEDKQYARTLEEKGMPAEKIRKYGFAFERKTVLIG